jgi:uncharacterized protein YciI
LLQRNPFTRLEIEATDQVMPFFVAVNEGGPSWDPSRSRREQEGWREHAEFIDRLAEEGFFLLVGPVSPTKSILILNATDEQEARSRLAKDPWREAGVLQLVSLEAWEVLVGKELLERPTLGP